MNISHAIPIDQMKASAGRASDFLRSIAHPQRLLVLCQLSQGERSVGELAELLDMRQSTLSQHLARLKAEGLLAARREGTMVFYSLERREVVPVIEALYAVFCGTSDPS
ncbi:metalloregulator ArsR/SmtB family transcription factor [Iodidimonas sp. SYSU 1G8]|uniref:ArsR/SmtB family transcription factor n=1 Tax=Iodidimonas sp. SYSU 1G8 TaxID=3133967 RepID=UPI0031FF17C9